ncbi:MAG: hypothetical protein JXR77_03560, partial [Lentisphaeria bacterium]|nr:hypothetical protein [Lentisphaeria bacterium]
AYWLRGGYPDACLEADTDTRARWLENYLGPTRQPRRWPWTVSGRLQCLDRLRDQDVLVFMLPPPAALQAGAGGM